MKIFNSSHRSGLVVIIIGMILVLAVACSPAGTSTANSQPGEAVSPPVQPETTVSTPVETLLTVTLETTTGSASFSQDVLPILQANCTRCHGTSRQSGGLMLNTYDNVMAGGVSGLVIQPGNAQESILVEKVTTGAMPKNGAKLSDANIQVIINWINAGALDD